MLEDSTAELLLHLGSTAPKKERRGASAKHSISFLLDEQESTQHGADPHLPSQEKRKHNKLESEDEQRSRQPKRTRRQQTNDGAPLLSPPASSSAPQPRPILPSSFSSAAVAPLGAHLNWPFHTPNAAASTALGTAGSPFFPFATLHAAGQPAIFLLPSLYVPSQPLLPAVQPQQQSAQSTRRDQKNATVRREEAFFAALAPGSPGLSSAASSPPSSPVPLLSSSPSSPGFTTTTTTTPSNPSPLSLPEKSARNDVDAKTPPEVDVQQHTQQLLKQWHRQRQVQKLLYIKQKTHKKNAIDGDSSRPATPAVASHASPVAPIAPVTTFTSAAAGQPSSMPAEALMALVEDLLQRHVGSWVPPPKPAPGEAAVKGHEKEHGKRRHRVPTEHLHVLEEVFAAEPFPHAAAKNVLAQRLGMTKRSVTIWFQNKRARLKRNDGELSSSPSSSSATSSSTSASSSSARSGGKPEGGIVFHQLTVDTAGQLAIIPEFPLDM